ncbi:MAG: DUF3656 domain-containing protein [Thermoanaerobacterales bacterium]|nr:DUF3656 domain-containing protein [Thermoanaerobacterales bacterium]
MDNAKQVRHPELLAPAGSWEALVAAVQNGADAVYLGARSFNARASAANFDAGELARAIDYAHVRDVNVYVTVNILLADTELIEAARLLHFLYQAGADGVIVQDLGLARLARDLLPDLPLHASTQMTVHNLSAMRFLKDLGFTRVVLARELSLDEIRNLKEESGLEVETFVHGALCVCYSGQCLMSSFIGGRSGNRGRCAQPCRLPYQLLGGDGGEPAAEGYLLSTRDLNLSGRLPELIAAGIDAFKIEGRLRRPEYVATVVGIYRRLLDRALGGSFYVRPEEERDLAQIFNRRFTTGYYFDSPGRELVNFKQPNNRGLPVGRVRRYDARSGAAEVALEGDLHIGDGVDFWVTVGGRVSTEVHRLVCNGREVEGAGAGDVVALPVKGRIRPGDRVFKTWDAAQLRRARESFTSPREHVKIPITAAVRAVTGEPLHLTLADGRGHIVEASGASPLPEAERHPASRDDLAGQLDRLGNTPFVLARLDAELDGRAMVPRSEVNAVRRAALEELEARRVAARRPRKALPPEEFDRRLGEYLPRISGPPVPAQPGKDGRGSPAEGPPGRPLLAVAMSAPAAVEAALRGGADIIYFPGEAFDAPGTVGERGLAEARRLCSAYGARLYYWIPRIVREAEAERYRRLARGADGPYDGILAGNLGLAMELAAAGLPVWADYPLNAFNGAALNLLARQGLQGACLSPEMTLAQVTAAAAAAPLPLEVLVHGSVPLMVSRYCVIGAAGGTCPGMPCTRPCRRGRFRLRDRIGISFPVAVDAACRMHIFNSRDLCVVDLVPVLARAGLARLRLDGRLKEPQGLERMTAIYRRVLDDLAERPGAYEVPEAVRSDLAALSPGGLTKGHYFRGVL